jgi:Bsp6I-like restriction endonuclease
MIKKQAMLNLPEGDFCAEVMEFEQVDILKLWNIYIHWRELCGQLNMIGARGVNLPEGLSESAVCIAKNMWRFTSRINGANTSFDCYDFNAPRNNNRIQVKACSVLPDLTSFGPNSQWDRIFFVDFYRQGNWDGTFDIYEISTDDIDNYPVNYNQTVRHQKMEGKRPRFSIYNGLILTNRYLSKETYQITQSEVKLING